MNEFIYVSLGFWPGCREWPERGGGEREREGERGGRRKGKRKRERESEREEEEKGGKNGGQKRELDGE